MGLTQAAHFLSTKSAAIYCYQDLTRHDIHTLRMTAMGTQPKSCHQQPSVRGWGPVRSWQGLWEIMGPRLTPDKGLRAGHGQLHISHGPV